MVHQRGELAKSAIEDLRAWDETLQHAGFHDFMGIELDCGFQPDSELLPINKEGEGT